MMQGKPLLPLTLSLLVVAGCRWHLGPTYPSNAVASALAHLCAKEYRMEVQTRRVGNTLQAFFWRSNLLQLGAGQDMKLEAAEALEHVLLCATRISLSTDAPLQFIEIKMADRLTGATVTLWRYAPDIRDSMLSRFGEEEYSNRLVLEMNPNAQMDEDQSVWDESLTLEQFLAKQVVLRAKRQSPVVIQVHEDLSKPSQLGVVVDNWSTVEKQGAAQKTKVTELVEKISRHVIRGYGFNGFRGGTLLDSRGSLVKRWTF